MSRRYTVTCHRCGKPTFVDLSKTISHQRCRSCRGYLQGVDVRGGEKAAVHRKKVIKLKGAAAKAPVWKDEETAVIPVRTRWPRRFKWSVGIVMTLLVAAIVQSAYLRFHVTNEGGIQPSVVQDDPVTIDVRETEVWRLRATGAARRALTATSTGELLQMLYHPGIPEQEIRDYYTKVEKLPLGTDLSEEYFIPGGDYPENCVAFFYQDAARRNRAFVMVEKPDGMKIDWPSLVGYGEMTLQEYVRTRPDRAVVLRLKARKGKYYNDHFSDDKKWLSVRLTDLMEETVIHGYYDRSSSGTQDLIGWLPEADAGERADEPVTVALRFPAGAAKADQAEMVRVLNTWYLRDGLKPFVDQVRKLETASGETPPAPAPESPPAPVTGDTGGKGDPPPGGGHDP